MTSGLNPSQQPFDSAASQPPAEETLETAADGPSLEEVVRQTLNARGADEKLSPEVHAELLEVRRRHASQTELELPAVQELIDAVLTCRFEALRERPDSRALVRDRIAQLLWDDTPSRELLERLWRQLLEEAR